MKEDIIDMIINAIVIGTFIFVIMLALSFVSDAKISDHYPISGICKKEVEMIDKAERIAKYEIEKERQRMEEEKKIKEAYEQRLIQIFGYCPTADAIMRAKRVCMAEGGNTESVEGLERILEVIANRVKSDRFPNTIDGVIFQKYQFETVTTGRIWQYEINDKVEQAWDNLIDRGYCNDNKVLFFTAGGYNPYCVPAYKLENHYFGY